MACMCRGAKYKITYLNFREDKKKTKIKKNELLYEAHVGIAKMGCSTLDNSLK